MIELSKLLCERIHSLSELSETDKQQVRLLLLDFFAAACAGYKQNAEFNACVEKTVWKQGGAENSSVFFSAKKCPERSAAFLNSLYGHGAELDDGNKKAMGHVGVHIIPAVLAVAETEHKTQDEIMLAIAAGYEAYIRISAAAQPGMVARSFHSTGMAGAPACAVACAKLLGLDAKGIESAMSLGCTMASGLLTYSESQQMIKPINPAKAAESGVFAARLAQAGVVGPFNCLEGPNGWFRAATDCVHEEMITEYSLDSLLIHDCYFKLYPSCRHTHCGIEAAIHLHHQVDVDAIQSIKVNIYPNAIKLAGIQYPQNADETKFSIPYTLACGLLYGEYEVDYMNPPRLTAEVRHIIDKIEMIPDESMEDRVKSIRGTNVTVCLTDGTEKACTVLVPKGDPEKPLTTEDIILKFKTCASGLICAKEQDAIIDHLLAFGGLKTLDPNVLLKRSEEDLEQ